MIDIQVTGGTKRQRELVESIAHYSIRKLMPRKRVLDINIHLARLDDALGYAHEEFPGSYVVEIHKGQGLRRLLETVAHEMVHVKQYARREITGKDTWLGKFVNSKTVNYYDLPWEIEAHGREVGLFLRWCTDTGNAHRAWAQDPL